MKTFSKILKWAFLTVLSFLIILFVLLFVGQAPQAEKIKWGVNFSIKHTWLLGLDWQETYLAILDELGAKRIKLITHWDNLEKERGEYFFDDLDWQISEAEKRKVEIIPVIGMKTPRWPECHLPVWATNLPKKAQQQAILELLETIISRYQGSKVIAAWQIENEPLFPFGLCPWTDKEFLKQEVALVRSLDEKKRPIIITDTGEWSFWLKTAAISDVVGISLYQKAYNDQLKRVVDYPFPPIFYWRKAKLVEKISGKKVVVTELQVEPWSAVLLYDLSLEEQFKTMDLEQFKENIAYAKKTGLDEFHLWGTEWHYWLKEKQNQPAIWNEAKKLFQNLN